MKELSQNNVDRSLPWIAEHTQELVDCVWAGQTLEAAMAAVKLVLIKLAAHLDDDEGTVDEEVNDYASEKYSDIFADILMTKMDGSEALADKRKQQEVLDLFSETAVFVTLEMQSRKGKFTFEEDVEHFQKIQNEFHNIVEDKEEESCPHCTNTIH